MLDNTMICGRRCEIHEDNLKRKVLSTGVVLGYVGQRIVVETTGGGVECVYPAVIRFVEDAKPVDAALVRALQTVRNGDVRAVPETLLREALNLGLVYVTNGKYVLTELGERAL